MKTVIITDSTCDLTIESQQQLDVEVVPLTVSYNNVNYDDGFNEANRGLFFDGLRNGKIVPITSQPSPDKFLSVFNKNKELGNEVVYIGISSNSSGTVQAARVAKNLCGYDKIHIIDSMQLSHGLEVLIRFACSLRDKGKMASEIVKEISHTIPKVRFISYVDSLKFLKKGGRVEKYSAFDDGRLNMKTLVSMINGRFTPVGVCRGSQIAFEKFYEFMDKHQPDENMPMVLTNADNKENMIKVKDFLLERGMDFNYNFSEIGQVIGSHMGPGTVGLAYIEK
ncbi:MAG: DegV family protein [Oscillospiraceae bacterium]|nr:DegV family protein [Oscillospiraceae bacterium]